MRFDYPNLAIEYDREANALYIYVKEGEGAEETLSPMAELNVDLNKNGHVVGVEVFL